jgi:hypothetical protein
VLPSSNTSDPRDVSGKSIFGRIGATILSSLSATMAIIPSHTPAGVSIIMPMFANNGRHDVGREERDAIVGNAAPIHGMTAVERTWYEDHGLPVLTSSWLKCYQSSKLTEYRLENGKLDIEIPPPGYEVAMSTR